jgi:broad specificity phosphatase PhoE
MIYVIASPPNKLDTKGRVSGWRHVPLLPKAKDSWRALLAPLKGRELNAIVSSDLDSEAANLAGRELGVPVRTDFGYRRFNVGRYHARPTAVTDDAIRAAEGRWARNPDIPIREGDSLTSLNKRLVKNFDRLLDEGKDVLFVTDIRTINFIRGGFNPHELVPNGNTPEVGKIYKVKRAGAD